MAYQITKEGIEILSAKEVADNIINGTPTTAGMKTIYGEDTNFDQDTPDAQHINIFAQCIRDISECIVQVFNSFDPDQASGKVLDARVLYNGVVRKGGTYTQVDMTIVAEKAVTLQGIDQKTDNEITDDNVFTVKDYIGNKYYLISTQTLSVGTNLGIPFRAQYMGDTRSSINSINEIVTPRLGVLSVNNPNEPSLIGVSEETDEQLKIRRAKAVGLGMLGSVEVMQASLRQLTDVVDAVVFENKYNDPTEDGIPPHSIWIIVRGGNINQIATVVYLRLNAGCGMKGDVTVPVLNIFGEYENMTFDFAEPEYLSVRLHAKAINGADVIDPQVLADYIAYNYSFKIYEPATATRVDAVCKAFSNQFSYSGIEISAGANTRGKIKTSSTLTLSNWQDVLYGCLNVTLNGTDTVQINGLNFSGVQSFVAVANIISEAFKSAGYGAYAEGDATSITLYSNKRGSGSSIAINAIEGGFADLYGTSYLDVANIPAGNYVQGTAAERGYIVCNTMDSSQITALNAVNNGSFTITVDMGSATEVTGLDFTSAETAEDVAIIINTALQAVPNLNASCDNTGLNVSIYSNTYGTNSTISITAGTTGTNVATASLLIDPTTTGVAGVNATNGSVITSGLNVSNWEGVDRGAIAIKVNGGATKSVAELDFRACDSATKIATYLTDVFTANGIFATVTASNGELLFTSNIAGEDSSIAFVVYSGSFVDISEQDYLERSTMIATAGVSPQELSWDTLLYPTTRKNYFEIDASYISVTVDE